jgi:hypothetical protein
MKLINEAEVRATWNPIIKEATGVEDTNKLGWMSKYAHFHTLYEEANNAVHLNPGMNVPGMGPVTLPGDPGTQNAFTNQTTGSGDKAYSLLPLALQVAAQTIGLDLVPVIPMSGPLGMMTYLDFVYAGGTIGAVTGGTDGAEAPLLAKFAATSSTGATAISAGDVLYSKIYSGSTAGTFRLTFVANSRIDNYPIFKVETATDTSGTSYAKGLATPNETLGKAIIAGNSLFSSKDTQTAATDVLDIDGAAELVKSLEDHVTGFSGRGLSGLSGSNVSENNPYGRGEGESQQDNIMGLSLFNKSVEAKTFQVAAAVTREQIQDLKQFGIDAVAQVEAILTNELTQSINKNILDRLFALGNTNNSQVEAYDNTQLSLYIASSGSTNFDLGNDNEGNTVVTGNVSASVPTAGDNKGTLQRQILSRILAASNLVSIRGRRGAANFAVTNGQVATALQDISGFTPYAMANTFNQQGGSLFPVGQVAGVTVYVDPLMGWNDNKVLVGRKGDGNSPGLVFMPYLMAESVSTIAEGTMAPKIAIKSRYALVEAGFHPQLYYYSFGVDFSTYQMI